MHGINGLNTALDEITLVLFTTLAPSGAIALILMGLPVLLGRVTNQERTSIDHFMCIPLVTALVGLVASSTHLGNPANALYVLAGVGRSPLSNEVFAGVVFLGLAGIYWLTSFSEHPRVALRRIGLALVTIAGIGFVSAIALAYNAETIATWHSPLVPTALWLNSLVGGPLLALLSFQAAGWRPAERKAGRQLVAASAIAAVANTLVYGLQAYDLAAIENHLTSAIVQAPFYPAMVLAFAILTLSGVAMAAQAIRPPRKASLPRLIIACALAGSGIFVMRFAFYMTHLTVGVGI